MQQNMDSIKEYYSEIETYSENCESQLIFSLSPQDLKNPLVSVFSLGWFLKGSA